MNFNLSDKRFKIHNFPKRETYNYPEEDVKEFIRLLKEELGKFSIFGDNDYVEEKLITLKNMIDKIAGDSLK